MFVSKALLIVFVQMWIRWTLPRPRIDQVLYACVKVLLPMACVLLLGTALWELLVPDRPGVAWVEYRPWNISDESGARGGSAVAAFVTQLILALVGVGLF